MASIININNKLSDTINLVSEVILGKEPTIELALTCLLARGHLLIEDLPGMGKTTLAHALAVTLGLRFQRIQFTSDLLPADILGLSIYDRERGDFRFHPGPVFTQLLLADEINRATPKAQSALLEAMEEHQVTLDGEARPLPEPFFVVATQNPLQQLGTFALPESQLDRFLMRLSLGYPDAAAERALLSGQDRRQKLETLRPVLTAPELIALQSQIETLHIAPPILDYIQALLLASRRAEQMQPGLSPRAGLALVRASRAFAAIRGRDYVIPEDVQAIFEAVAGHRLGATGTDAQAAGAMSKWLLEQVDLV
ncbi:AAA family ATPase [Acidihalobacter yilgarnensis]|uniref:AAA family ATPase n=1 Tax=Acidihalobacter yilgarnensis TaxID=2819280 RepID=A0A1D8INW5_9GAMM|nr:MoxR family ATPase [Acidihalobacter yilgarnensis]AOU98121.1 AAA family ATPase [Acidihalobacter yilgarnensis]